MENKDLHMIEKMLVLILITLSFFGTVIFSVVWFIFLIFSSTIESIFLFIFLLIIGGYFYFILNKIKKWKLNE